MKSSGDRRVRTLPPGKDAKAALPPPRGKSGEGAESALHQLQQLEEARQRERRAGTGSR